MYIEVTTNVWGHDYKILVSKRNEVVIYKNNIWVSNAFWDSEYEVLLDCEVDLGDSYEENSEILMQLDAAISRKLYSKNYDEHSEY